MTAAAAAELLQSCPTLCDPIRRQPTRLPRPWDSPGKNTGVGCHFLLQCMKVKSETEVAQSCPTLHDPMDCSLPGSSIHGSFQARVLEWGAIHCLLCFFLLLSPKDLILVFCPFNKIRVQTNGKQLTLKISDLESVSTERSYCCLSAQK